MRVKTIYGKYIEINPETDIEGCMVKHMGQMYHVSKVFDEEGRDLTRFRKW